MKNHCAFLLLFAFLSLVCNKKEDKQQTPMLVSSSTVYGLIGDPVSLSGTNLAGALSVTFSGRPSTIIQNTSTQLTTVVPPGAAAGATDIVVRTAGGSSNSLPFEVFHVPAVVDSSPPSIEKSIPAANFTDFPILLYGDQLSGVLKVTFNDIPAVVYTNNRNVITTTVPAGLPAGSVTIRVTTTKGTATLPFQVQGPPPNGPASLNFSIVEIPPPAYVPTISNNWSCGLFSATSDSTFVELNSDPEFDDTYLINGLLEFAYEGEYNSANYIEFTNSATGETLAGQFSAAAGNPCVLKMVLISSKTGEITECTFDRRDNDQTLDCVE